MALAMTHEAANGGSMYSGVRAVVSFRAWYTLMHVQMKIIVINISNEGIYAGDEEVTALLELMIALAAVRLLKAERS